MPRKGSKPKPPSEALGLTKPSTPIGDAIMGISYDRGSSPINEHGLTRDDLRRHTRAGRRYVWPPGSENTFISVTTVLDALPKPALPRWAAKSVAEFAVEKITLLEDMAHNDPQGAVNWLKSQPWAARDKAADAGSAIHAIAEHDALGEPDQAELIMRSLGKEAMGKALAARDFFATLKPEILHTEAVVYHTQYGYAGTLDFILRFPTGIPGWPNAPEGEPLEILTDLKTGSGVYSEVALQLAAYRYADHMVDLATLELVPMVPVDGGAVLHTGVGEWALHPIECGPEVFDKFLTTLDVSKHLPLDRALVGSPVRRGTV